jgi:hypothetical protein
LLAFSRAVRAFVYKNMFCRARKEYFVPRNIPAAITRRPLFDDDFSFPTEMPRSLTGDNSIYLDRSCAFIGTFITFYSACANNRIE